MTPLKIPYGLADFQRLRREGFFYQDRTDRIEQLEATGHQLVFLRPRRFGKSLLLSMLENYYDVNKADAFGELFGDLAVGRNPTPLRNRFFILKWDFSTIPSYGNLNDIESAIHDHLNDRLSAFVSAYRRYFKEPVVLHPTNALSSLQSILTAVLQTEYRIYLLIDEYDNFANEVMIANNSHYGALLQGEGLLKTVFKNIKSAAGGLGLERVFITGVSPVVMSDMTSGYNVAKNIYLNARFNDLCGFTENEVRQLLQAAMPLPSADEALATVRTFYNGYRFAQNSGQGIYNPTLTLYFVDQWLDSGAYPRNLLDENLAMDRNKLQYLAGLPHGEDIIVKALGGDEPLAVEQLSERFGVEDMIHGVKDQTFMLSLLFYFGMLTLTSDSSHLGKQLLTIPNLVARKLYIERLRECLLRPDFDAREDIDRAVERFISTGDLHSLCDFIEQRYFSILSNRDYRWSNELTIKVAFMTLLYNDHLYMMVSETETRRRYADLSLIVRPDMRRFQALDLVLEFKYVKLTETGLTAEQVRASTAEQLAGLSTVSDRLAEAETQAREYMHDLQQRYPEAQLHGFAVVAIGFERLLWRKVAAAQISNH
ncbi:MAG: AAA family ATPase [Gammaproteobacteria bacterium HGW-Gammaproteobacteria-10]|nr:MAG: AAA family ATPase [Gammaproteobacteria bacterium HGW-Gammaproteobacteria-10]